ncbi:hypothetical protein LT85_3847 [Collimonas arenae]|uniref:Uncharacterized protein n=1 Tax=Collimonas arenae TaxID=279058 RepID=A0A0A1FH54_9BURK|nr:hypothetical protein [Collimonas arenae]AIY43005.1 hypothetical protein LT85_3847 [Collimonas arenae]
MKPIVEEIQAILKLVIDSAKLILAIGVVLVFVYCFSEGFSITGLSISDVFLFTYVAFSFSAIYTIGIIFGGFTTLWFINGLAWLFNRRKNKKSEAIVYPLLTGYNTVSLFLFVLAVAAGILLKVDPVGRLNADYSTAIFYFISTGFFVCLIFGIRITEPENALSKKMGVLIVLLVAIAYIVLIHPALLNLTMSQMGIRSKSSDVILLDSESYKKTISVAKLYGIPVKACQIPGQSTWVVEHLNVIWNFFGDKSYLEIFQVNQNTGNIFKSRQFFVPKTGVDIIRGGNQDLRCPMSDIK